MNGSVTVTEKPKEDIKDVTLADAEYTYDGSPKSIVVKGKLPEGAKVAYENNEKTDAGIYDVTAKITAPGYNDKVLSSKLTINKKELTVTGLKAENKTYDGTKNAVITGGTLTGAVRATMWRQPSPRREHSRRRTRQRESPFRSARSHFPAKRRKTTP